ncbi:MAG TPA: STAS domain-containing protein [Candidatus Kapabacteria bacterium]|jgi:anti-sigma B factor antagonist|nr:STAS domain-containing protein [Candidatus Kapabacteria bacterium]
MNQFSVTIRDCPPAQVVDLNGYLDAHTAPQLEQTFQQLLDGHRYKIIVNFRDLAYISSAGLGVFMAFIEEARGNNGDIKLVGMSPKVYNVFDLLGFPMLYEIFDEESEAQQRFIETASAGE